MSSLRRASLHKCQIRYSNMPAESLMRKLWKKFVCCTSLSHYDRIKTFVIAGWKLERAACKRWFLSDVFLCFTAADQFESFVINLFNFRPYLTFQSGSLCIHEAARKGHVGLVKMLLEKGVPVNIKNKVIRGSLRSQISTECKQLLVVMSPESLTSHDPVYITDLLARSHACDMLNRATILKACRKIGVRSCQIPLHSSLASK